MPLISKPGLIPLKVENNGTLITSQINKINFVGGVSGSIGNFNDITIQIGVIPTASFAISSSYALTSTSASYVLTSTSASYALTASYVANASSFPFTGSALITGSLGTTGSLSQSGSANIFLQGLINQTTATTHVVTFNNATGQLFITASSAFGGGGGGGTPGGATNTIQFNNAGTFSGSGNFTIIGGNTVSLTGSLITTGSTLHLGPITGSSFTGSFTGSLFGTSSWSSNAITASYVVTAQTASYVLNAVSSSFALTASLAPLYVLNSRTSSFATTGSNTFIGNQVISGSTNITGSLGVTGSINSTSDITAANNVTAQINLKSMFQAGDEGGEIFLNVPATNTTLATGVTIDVNQDKLRFFEQGGGNRGYYLDISSGSASAGTNLKPAGFTGTVTILGNPPPNNLNFTDGILINVT